MDLKNKDIDITSEAVLQAVRIQSEFEAKEEYRTSEMNRLFWENFFLKGLLVYLVVND